jgi:hypothetical protein
MAARVRVRSNEGHGIREERAATFSRRLRHDDPPFRSASILIALGTVVVAFALHDHVSCAPGVTACDPIAYSNPWRPMLVFDGVVLSAVLWLMASILSSRES